ncbi:MAG TPA: heparan-alpha-glucosaminide N-acetyltransferase [Spirochaetales bacterium]|nr:heparan-alpha-glucosaminide N-acetyltransferase [Spirochaetales bacterium]
MHRRSITNDAIKGGLVLAMIAYHACYVGAMFDLARLELFSGFWWMFPRVIAAGFVAVSGWNLAGKRAAGSGFGSFAKRAGKLGLVALAISAATRPVLGEGFVFFGVIHLLALSSLIAYPLLGRPALAIVAGAAALVAGVLLAEPRFGWPYLAWLGLRPAGLYPADYLPLAPWFAFVALGAAARDLLSRRPIAERNGPAGRRAAGPPAPAAKGWPIVAALAAIGRRSLPVYLVHLPVLYGIGWLVAQRASR